MFALVASYGCWAVGLGNNLLANGRLLEAAGVSTNAVSKLAHDLTATRSARGRRAAAAWGYVATEAVKELPYVIGAFGAAAASDSIGRREALVFLVGANLGATAYELLVAVGTRMYLRRHPRHPWDGSGDIGEARMLVHERRRSVAGLAAAEVEFRVRYPERFVDRSATEVAGEVGRPGEADEPGAVLR